MAASTAQNGSVTSVTHGTAVTDRASTLVCHRGHQVGAECRNPRPEGGDDANLRF
eukprot:CAMPEP_0117698980 /NCGR_PEP_ID=MMETSP0804-20121206/30036_1 /TAXON_ID=1074897 /ORGANISM="Tetraselmis astigmatica, Strain CCMP880" /LENGTH=54 /DNA_ID=CAMNT_0005513303 /DNA_START=122 /DNA_END=286 /DNA_ORIENTATION=-